MALDLHESQIMTDYVIIEEGTVSRHVKGIAEEIISYMEIENKEKPYKIEGEKEGKWIVLDYGDIMVHLLIPTWREKYSIEKVWDYAKIVDLNIKVNKR